MPKFPRSVEPIQFGPFTYDEDGFHIDLITREPVSKLKLLYRKNASRARLQEANKPWLIAQLYLYGIPFDERDSKVFLRATLGDALKSGKCDVIPAHVQETERSMERKWREQMDAFLDQKDRWMEMFQEWKRREEALPYSLALDVKLDADNETREEKDERWWRILKPHREYMKTHQTPPGTLEMEHLTGFYQIRFDTSESYSRSDNWRSLEIRPPCSPHWSMAAFYLGHLDGTMLLALSEESLRLLREEVEDASSSRVINIQFFLQYFRVSVMI